MSNHKWKSGLLSSGLPLEFEVTKLLVSKGFVTVPDYVYARKDSGQIKDFSVDIKASYADRTRVNLVLLIECKYRINSKKWLFVPDVNRFVSSNLINAIRLLDEFSCYQVNRNHLEKFDGGVPVCVKGTEINVDKGDVYDSDIRQGVMQLQYALPRLLMDEIMWLLTRPIEEGVPFLFCPILVTHADLFVLNDNVSIVDVESAGQLPDISTQVPSLFFQADYGADFARHCEYEFRNLAHPLKEMDKMVEEGQLTEEYMTNHQTHELFLNIAAFDNISERRSLKSSPGMSPSFICRSLINAGRYHLLNYFSKFIICSFASLPSLIDDIVNITIKVERSRRKIQT